MTNHRDFDHIISIITRMKQIKHLLSSGLQPPMTSISLFVRTPYLQQGETIVFKSEIAEHKDALEVIISETRKALEAEYETLKESLGDSYGVRFDEDGIKELALTQETA